MQERNKIYSVTEFIASVNDRLEMDFDMVTIHGELRDLKISQNKWVWFTLKDQESSMSCFMTVWAMNQMPRVTSKEVIAFEDGMEVKATGFPSVFNRSGKFIFKPQLIEPVGEGALKKQLELLRRKFQEEGLFDLSRKRNLPKFPEHIGLITSREAAAYSDFLKVLKARWGGLQIDFYHVAVQGVDAVGDIVKAFDFFDEKKNPPEVLVLTRGGGSLEDLMAFNSEEVVRAIFRSKIPVICAIGHERDECISEMVSDVRASTPSNAAELLVPHREDYIRELLHATHILTHSLSSQLDQYEVSLQSFFHTLNRSLSLQITRHKHFAKALSLHLIAFSEKLAYHKQSVLAMEKLLRSLTPQEILKRGFSITKDKAGKIVKKAKDLKTGDEIRTQFIDAEVRSNVL